MCCSLDVESNNVVLVARGQAVPEIGWGQVETFAIQDWSSLTDTKPELNRLMVLTLVHSSPLLELIGTQIWPLILAELTVEPDSSPAAPRFVITVLPATERCAVGQHQISDREIHFSDRGNLRSDEVWSVNCQNHLKAPLLYRVPMEIDQ